MLPVWTPRALDASLGNASDAAPAPAATRNCCRESDCSRAGERDLLRPLEIEPRDGEGKTSGEVATPAALTPSEALLGGSGPPRDGHRRAAPRAPISVLRGGRSSASRSDGRNGQQERKHNRDPSHLSLPLTESEFSLSLLPPAHNRPGDHARLAYRSNPAALGGDDLIRLRQVRLAQGSRGRLDHAPSVRIAPRAAAGTGREVDRHARDARARDHVRHLLAPEAHEVRERAGRPQVRVLVVRESRGRRRRRRGVCRRRRQRRRPHLTPVAAMKPNRPYGRVERSYASPGTGRKVARRAEEQHRCSAQMTGEPDLLRSWPVVLVASAGGAAFGDP